MIDLERPRPRRDRISANMNPREIIRPFDSVGVEKRRKL